MSGTGTGERLVGAGVWAVGGKLLARVIDLGALLLLAVLLLPEDFGLVAMAMTLVLLVEAVTDLPIGQPILRVRQPTPDLYDTAFTLGVVRALVVGGAIAALARPMALYFQEPRLVPLITVLALAPMLRGCASPRMMDYTRAYDMRRDFLVSVLSKLAAFTAVTIVALMTRSHWAIAVGTITTPFVMLLLSYILAPYHPRFGLRQWREFTDIIGWNTLTQTISALNFQIDRILLGRALPVAPFGRYSLASDLSGIPFQGVLFPLFPPLSAAFARAETAEARRIAWEKALNAMINIMGPVLLGMALLAEPLVIALLGAKWQEAAPYLTGLALFALPSVMGHALTPLAMANYRLRLVTQRQAVELVFKLPMIMAGIYWGGVWGAIAARGLAVAAAAIYALAAAGQITGQSVSQQLWSLRRPVAGMVVFVVLAMALCPAVTADDGGAVLRLWLLVKTLAAGGVALAGHVLTVGVLWRAEGRPEGIESVLLSRLRRRRRQPE